MSNLRESAAVVTGSFVDYRLIKTRNAFQVVIEMPVEDQERVFKALGYPRADTNIPVAVARLVNTPSVADQVVMPVPYTEAPREVGDGVARQDRSAQGKAHYASLPEMEKAVVRAAQLPKDLRFRQWAARGMALGNGDCGIELAIKYIRDLCCEGASRGLIADDPECYERFIAMETEYRMDTGQMAEVR